MHIDSVVVRDEMEEDSNKHQEADPKSKSLIRTSSGHTQVIK